MDPCIYVYLNIYIYIYVYIHCIFASAMRPPIFHEIHEIIGGNVLGLLIAGSLLIANPFYAKACLLHFATGVVR